MDINYEIGNYQFNARAAVLIFNKEQNKILLFKVNDGRDFYLLPGGRIHLYEDSHKAIKREIKEELGYDIDLNLCSIQENFLKKKNQKITQYCFYYRGIYMNPIEKHTFVSKDNKKQTFHWVEISKLDNYKIYPKNIYELINSNSIKHNIVKV